MEEKVRVWGVLLARRDEVGRAEVEGEGDNRITNLPIDKRDSKRRMSLQGGECVEVVERWKKSGGEEGAVVVVVVVGSWADINSDADATLTVYSYTWEIHNWHTKLTQSQLQ